MAGEAMLSKRALTITRGVWWALLVVQLFFGMGAVLVVGYRPGLEAVIDPPWPLYAVAAVALVVLAVAGYMIRRRLYQRRRRDDGAVQPDAYLTGNLVLLISMGVMGVAGMGVALAAMSMFPAVYITLAALSVQVVNMPTGDPLEPGRYADDQTPKSA
ncbi:hypothetical protein ACERK3_15745 [Phycisphaerales bacterium AB-hyl4]|uniref:Uncharacterized protein n=1 Tax=Natronomicrosphaera hydrolytica TaxID=3242702 RepID=A0ABV4U9G6_9BACT